MLTYFCLSYGSARYYSEGDRHLFNSCYHHSMAGTVLVSLCPQPGPGRCSQDSSEQGEQTRKESIQLRVWWVREKSLMSITAPKTSSTAFHIKTQPVGTCLSRSRKFLGKYSNCIIGSQFHLQSSKHGPSHWPTETNPGSLSRPSSNLPLHDITPAHMTHRSPWVGNLSPAACVGYQCLRRACYREIMLPLGMPHFSCPVCWTESSRG